MGDTSIGRRGTDQCVGQSQDTICACATSHSFALATTLTSGAITPEDLPPSTLGGCGGSERASPRQCYSTYGNRQAGHICLVSQSAPVFLQLQGFFPQLRPMFCTSHGRRRHGHRNLSRLLHEDGPSSCRNRICVSILRLGRRQEVQNTLPDCSASLADTARGMEQLNGSLQGAMQSPIAIRLSLSSIITVHAAFSTAISTHFGHGHAVLRARLQHHRAHAG